jgi:hypothetical protein
VDAATCHHWFVLAGPGGDDGFEAALLDSAQATIDSLEIVDH